jgi:hypothetical protein
MDLIMEILPTALIVIGGLVILFLILKFIGGCLLRILLIVAVVALAGFLVYQFIW